MDNLRALKGHERPANVLRITIPKSMRRKALEDLYYMNISRTSLFPGLDGYSQSLAVYNYAYNKSDVD